MFNKIYLDPLFLVFAFICVLTGSFKIFLVYTSIIFVHELGHFLVACLFKWEVDKIYFYPYGGFTKLNSDINKPLYEELIILLMGPLFQIAYCYIICFLVSTKTSALFMDYHKSILIFNLLPILPLDGGKLVNIMLSFFRPYLNSLNISIIVSFLFIIPYIIFCFVYNYQLNFILILLVILCKLIGELKKKKYYFNRFILERYLNNYNYKHMKLITSDKSMYRGYKHLFRVDNRYITEREYLKKKYHYM